MIKIFKGGAPCELVQANYKLTNEMILEFETYEMDFVSGKKTFTNFADAYKMVPVKLALIQAQYNKCCFSEAKFNGDYSDVEHFRPKGRIDSWPDGKPSYPGYYWLAYDWSNLFLCKKRVNTSEKRNFFPLDDESTRNKFHFSNNNEKTLLIDISNEDPRKHIRFEKSQPVPLSERGRFNIKFFNLRHPEFVDARRIKFELLKTIKDLVDKGLAEGKDADHFKSQIELLGSHALPSAEFSSMARDLLKGWPPLASVLDSDGNLLSS